MSDADPRQLKDKATAAVAKGKWKKALEVYTNIERIEPLDGMWPRKIGEMWRRLSKHDEAVVAFDRAANLYSKQGFLLKAIAVCQLILELDKNHTHTQDRLAAYYAARSGEKKRRPRSDHTPTLEPNAALDALPLGSVLAPVTGEIAAVAPTVGVFEVPLVGSGAFDAAFESHAGPAPTDQAANEERETAEAARSVFPKVPLFSSLDEAHLRMLIERVHRVDLEDGHTLFQEGDDGDALYVIAHGEVVVHKNGAEVARLGEGAFFGEIALVTNQPRNATIIAAGSVGLLAIDRNTVGELIADDPEVLKVLLRFIRDRLVDTLVDTNPLFAPFSGGEREHLAAKFRFLEVEAGVELISQGKKAPGLYLLLAGTADVTIDGGNVATLCSGDLFGEISLLTHEPAIARIVTLAKCFLLKMDSSDFTEAIMTHPQLLEYVNSLVDERKREVAEIRSGAKSYRPTKVGNV